MSFYSRLHIKNLKVYINSIGNNETRKKFKDALRDFLRPHVKQLSLESQARFEVNPLRILDSKNECDLPFIEKAPSILDFLDLESKEHFEKLQSLLHMLNIPFEVNPRLVRGLDYYNKTVFEVVAGELGAQNSIGGGGRYDGLMKTLGGPDLPCMGFGTGLERIIQTLLRQEVSLPEKPAPYLFIIALGDECKSKAFSLLHEMRSIGVSAQMDLSFKKIKQAMQFADSIKAKYVVVIGENEIKTNQVEIKEMSTGMVTKATWSYLTAIFSIKVKRETMQPMLEEMSEMAHAMTQQSMAKIEAVENQTSTIQSLLSNVSQILKPDSTKRTDS